MAAILNGRFMQVHLSVYVPRMDIKLSFQNLTIAPRRQRGVSRLYRPGELTPGQLLHSLRSLQLPGAIAHLTGIVDLHFEDSEDAI
jgi:hypothetical protein